MGRVLRFLDSIEPYVPLMQLAKRAVLRLVELKTKLKRLPYTIRLRQFRNETSAPIKKRRVLVVMNLGIGNAVEATPLVQAIRMLWPKAEITILPPGDLFDEWCLVDHIAHSIEELRGQSYTHTFFAWLTGRQKWQGRCELGQTYYAPHRLKKWPVKAEREYNLDMIRRLGYKGPTPPLYISVRQPEPAIAPAALSICLVSGGKAEPEWQHKRWPYYGQLTEGILSKYSKAQIRIIGLKEDEPLGGFPSSPRIIDLRGHLTLRETAWVLRNANLVIGNDCGPMHIADAVQVPALVIFGPTCELKNRPLHKAVAVYHTIPCRPCQYDNRINTCQYPKCMTELKPDLVIKKVEALLKTP